MLEIKGQYFEVHPTVLIGIQSSGRTFNGIYAPLAFSEISNTPDYNFLNNPKNPEEEYNGSPSITKTKERNNNLS